MLCLRAFGGAPSPWGRLGWGSYVGLYAPLTTPAALLHLIIYIPFIKRVVPCSLHGVIIGLESDTKSFVPFQGFALLRLRVVADIPESGLSDIRHHPPPRLPTGRLKRSKIKKPPLAVKKARLFAGTKNEYIICTISFQGAYINRGSDICNLMDKQQMACCG